MSFFIRDAETEEVVGLFDTDDAVFKGERRTVAHRDLTGEQRLAPTVDQRGNTAVRIAKIAADLQSAVTHDNVCGILAQNTDQLALRRFIRPSVADDKKIDE